MVNILVQFSRKERLVGNKVERKRMKERRERGPGRERKQKGSDGRKEEW